MFNGRLVNLHNQPLPKFRGGGVSWNIPMGAIGGAAIHQLIERVDAGPILLQKSLGLQISSQFRSMKM